MENLIDDDLYRISSDEFDNLTFYCIDRNTNKKHICGSNFEMHFVDAIWRCAF